MTRHLQLDTEMAKNNLAVIFFTEGGKNLANKIRLAGDYFYNKDKKIKPMMAQIMRDYKNIVFISATGIAVRYIAPYIKSKDVDPAVIVIDEGGNFVISLLSGHLGGANEVAKRIADRMGATPVITTASDVLKVPAIDIFAKENKLIIEDLSTIAAVMGRVVEGKNIFYSTNTSLKYPYEFITKDIEKAQAALVVGDYFIETDLPVTYLRPLDIYVGVGCKRGKTFEDLYLAVKNAFDLAKISMKSIAEFRSIDLKKDEAGIVELADFFNRKFITYDSDTLLKVQGDFKTSDFVAQTTGVDAVSSRSAMVGADELILDKHSENGVTVSLARKYI